MSKWKWTAELEDEFLDFVLDTYSEQDFEDRCRKFGERIRLDLPTIKERRKWGEDEAGERWFRRRLGKYRSYQGPKKQRRWRGDLPLSWPDRFRLIWYAFIDRAEEGKQRTDSKKETLPSFEYVARIAQRPAEQIEEELKRLEKTKGCRGGITEFRLEKRD